MLPRAYLCSGSLTHVALGVLWAQCTRVGCHWEGWVHSTRCGGSCSMHNPWPVAPEARGVAGRGMADCACGEVTGRVPRVSSQTKLEVSVAHTRRRCPSGSVATKV